VQVPTVFDLQVQDSMHRSERQVVEKVQARVCEAVLACVIIGASDSACVRKRVSHATCIVPRICRPDFTKAQFILLCDLAAYSVVYTDSCS
jgi:hypothetical protein